MTNVGKAFLVLCVALIASMGINAYQVVKIAQMRKIEATMGANTQFGMPCLYTDDARTLTDASGSALTCDHAGRIILTN